MVNQQLNRYGGMRRKAVCTFLTVCTALLAFTPLAWGQNIRTVGDPTSIQMKIVPDPSGMRQATPAEIARIQSGYERQSDSTGVVTLNFRVNSTVLEKDYMNNATALDEIHRTFSNEKIIPYMDFITVTAAASPEGNTVSNERLAAERSLAIKSYILRNYPFIERERIFTFSIGEDWPGLRQMVERDMNVPYRRQALDILDLRIDSDTKLIRLRNLDDGSTYRYISQHMLPNLRGAAACMIFYKGGRLPEVITQVETDTVFVDRVVESIVEVPFEVKKPATYYMAVKTNLLYDVALLPNLAIEFSLGRRWSMEIEGQWSWWNTKTTHNNCWRIQTAGLEFRKWLGDKSRTPLTGHYLGLYGAAGTYDVKFRDQNGYLSDMSYSMGLSYGYSMPIGRRLNLELGIAVGYLGGKYKVYDQYDEQFEIFPLQEERNMHYFGPTKAKISLVWLIGSGVNDTKKR